jgi:hypothetical protein
MFPDGWKESDTEEWDGAFANEDETIVILFSIGIADSIEEAEEAYEGIREGYDANEYSLGDEAFWAERADNARLTVRLRNAVGQVVASRYSSGEAVPDPGRAQTYGAEMVDRWREILE